MTTGVKEPKPGEKRPKEEEDEESRKKRKKEEAPASGAATVVKGRTTRGSSLEKSTGSSGNKCKGGKGSGSDRRSPSSLSNSAANSPSRQTRQQQQQQEQGESDSDGDGENSKKSSDSTEGLKVPPLKIVLSGNGNGNGNGGGSGNSAPGGSGANTPTEGDGEARKGDSPSASAATVATTEAATTNLTSAVLKEGGDEATSADALSKNVEDKSEEAGGSDSLDGSKAASAARMTRSRANQGTPGPEGTSSSTTGTYGGDAPEAVIAAAPVASTESSSGGSATEAAIMGSSREEGTAGRNSHYTEYHVKKRKLRSQVEQAEQSAQGNGGSSGSRIASSGGTVGAGMISGMASATVAAGSSTGGTGGGGSTSTSGFVPTGNEPLNDIQKYLNIRKQVEQRRKNLFPVHPKPPQGYRDYLMNRKTYLLQGNASERLRSMPMLQPPPSLEGAMRNLFLEQEKARYQLRKRHLVEKEKLVLTVEQEIIRVHGRAARALANQPFPYSVCTILRDEEIYTPIDSQAEEKNRDIRSRYNGRLFLSWLQDVDDKWEKIKVGTGTEVSDLKRKQNVGLFLYDIYTVHIYCILRGAF